MSGHVMHVKTQGDIVSPIAIRRNLKETIQVDNTAHRVSNGRLLARWIVERYAQGPD